MVVARDGREHVALEDGVLEQEGPQAAGRQDVAHADRGDGAHDLTETFGPPEGPLEDAVFDMCGDGRVGEVLRLLPVEAVQVVDGVIAQVLQGGGRRQ